MIFPSEEQGNKWAELTSYMWGKMRVEHINNLKKDVQLWLCWTFVNTHIAHTIRFLLDQASFQTPILPLFLVHLKPDNQAVDHSSKLCLMVQNPTLTRWLQLMVNPGAFQGLRKQFLMNERPAYKSGILGGYAANALANIQCQYFRQFPIDDFCWYTHVTTVCWRSI